MKRIGSILVDLGFITRDNLGHALEQQQDSGEPLGCILITMGLIGSDVLREVLLIQARLNGHLYGSGLTDGDRLYPSQAVVARRLMLGADGESIEGPDAIICPSCKCETAVPEYGDREICRCGMVFVRVGNYIGARSGKERTVEEGIHVGSQ